MSRVQAVRILLLVIFFGSWEAGGRFGLLDRIFFGMPSAIFLDLFHLFISGEVLYYAWVTLQEALIGFFLGAVLGIALAFAPAASPFWARVFDPFIFVFYGIPRIALAPCFAGMELTVIKACLEMDKEAFSSTGIVSQKGRETAVKVFTDAKVIDQPVPFEAIVNNSFSKKAQHP